MRVAYEGERVVYESCVRENEGHETCHEHCSAPLTNCVLMCIGKITFNKSSKNVSNYVNNIIYFHVVYVSLMKCEMTCKGKITYSESSSYDCIVEEATHL